MSRKAKTLLKRLIRGGIKTHRPVGLKARNADVVGVARHAARNDLSVAAGGACDVRGDDGLGAATVLSVLPVRQAGRRDGGAGGGASVGACGQAVGSGDGSHELGFWQDHDQHPDDLGDVERHGHSVDLGAAAQGGKLEHEDARVPAQSFEKHVPRFENRLVDGPGLFSSLDTGA